MESLGNRPSLPQRGQRFRTKLEVLSSILESLAFFASEDPDGLDVKMLDTVISEMTEAFRAFKPFRDRRKLTMFGSARTRPSEPLYQVARELAEKVAQQGWMVVTGAGPGIMAAGIEGAGKENSFGVNIRLPHEQQPNAFLAQDPKLVEMRYFFTRKLMLIKESDGYVVLPGGFGTQDEVFELLTLIQTGKAEPAPVVLLDVDGDNYWDEWLRFVRQAVSSRGYVSPDDLGLINRAESAEKALKIVMDFYSNYQSLRWIKDKLVLRVKRVPSSKELETLNSMYGDILAHGLITVSDPFKVEILENDNLEFGRVVLAFDKSHYGRLHELILSLNSIR